ncbi:tyrosine recombinase XerS [Lactobacillus sp. DCY120]|uniref:Tyrosine recombinase XerS n=1 Tax=Bombilactobacillus apium TaxID=2675299 RepID=A0A850R8R9_9LACO|nr:tyrosine recombinase XerS [Bombilactobacillus apium]NVY95796.1 tyrosine recombinase XerS [Bombilactobacillus apium]
MDKAHYIANNEQLVAQLPTYVQQYYLEKSVVPLSPATLYQYLNEFKRFFTWLIDTGVSSAANPAAITLEELEHLSKQDVGLYKAFLLNRGKANKKNPQGTLSVKTVNRSLNALGALFRYLTVESEGPDGEPYFYRNVMKKVSLIPDSETFQARAQNIKAQLLLDNDQQYLEFIAHDYGAQQNNRKKLNLYQRDRERDLAINALLLGSGIRVSELTNTNLTDLNWEQAQVKVQRKGGKFDTVPIAQWVLPYLQPYLEIRTLRYQATSSTPALFLTKGRPNPRRISSSTVELLVAKYSQAFNQIRITPHKLRHTLASKLYLETKNEHLVATQLGQSSTKATGLYTHIIDTQQKQALNQINQPPTSKDQDKK